MKKTIISTIATVALLVGHTATAAEPASKEVTLKGQAMCAKCELKQADACADVMQVKADDGQVTTYWIAKNDVTKDFHSNVCTDTVNLTATGMVGEVDGKKILVASTVKIEQ